MYRMTLRIVAVCVVLQVLQSLHPGLEQFQVFRLSYAEHLTTLPLFFITLISYMFSHAGRDHLLGNMFVGIPTMAYVEKRLGSRKMLKLFFISGLVAAVTHACMPMGVEGLIGASGAIFGILAASCVLFANGRASRVLGMAMLAMVLVPQLMALSMGPLGDNVAFAAHLGGALAGILYVLLHLKDKK